MPRSLFARSLSVPFARHLQHGQGGLVTMQASTVTLDGVNSENENIPCLGTADFVWGAREIGETIGRTERQAHHLLTTGQLQSAKKKGGRWVASRAALLREFGA